MQLKDAIALYLDHVRYERKLSKTTCKHYASWLHTFTDWLTANGYPDPTLDAFNTLTLRRYQIDKAKAGARPRTILSAFHPLRGMAKWMIANNVIGTDPTKAVQMPKKDAAVRHTLTDADVTALFDACRRQVKPRQQALCRAVLAVLAYGGLRREEACCLLVDDVNVLDKSLLIRSGKGAKSRRVFINTDGVNAIREWLAVREPDTKHTYLFSLDRNRRMHHTGIASLVEALAATAGMADNPAAKPHSLRHWCATNLLRRGATLKDIQVFLGHSSLAVTSAYLHSGEQELRNIAELTGLCPKDTNDQQPASRVVRRDDRERPRLRRIVR